MEKCTPVEKVDLLVEKNLHTAAVMVDTGGSLVTLMEKCTPVEKVDLLVEKNLHTAAVMVAYSNQASVTSALSNLTKNPRKPCLKFVPWKPPKLLVSLIAQAVGKYDSTVGLCPSSPTKNSRQSNRTMFAAKHPGLLVTSKPKGLGVGLYKTRRTVVMTRARSEPHKISIPATVSK